MAPSPSGKAKVCKTFITSSILVGASNLKGGLLNRLLIKITLQDKQYTPVWRNGRRTGLKILGRQYFVSVRPRPPGPLINLINSGFLFVRWSPSNSCKHSYSLNAKTCQLWHVSLRYSPPAPLITYFIGVF